MFIDLHYDLYFLQFLDQLCISDCYRNLTLTLTIFALFSNVVWHLMIGCVRYGGMTLCAKINYVEFAWNDSVLNGVELLKVL